MADQEYKVKISVDGAQKAQSDVKGVDSALGGMGKSALKAGAAMFAAGGVIAAYQKLNAFADVAVKTERVGDAFENLTRKARFAGDTIGKMQGASRGMVSNFELMRQTNNALLLSVASSSDQMAEMTVIARRLGGAMGIDTAQALESLVIGIGRQSRLWLDNLGIVVDAERAYKDLARSMGVTVEMLTEQQKKLAFTNETMLKARELVEGLGTDSESQADKIGQFRAEWENTKETLGKGAIPVLIVLNDTLKLLGGTAELLVQSYKSDAWKGYLKFWDNVADRMAGITPEMRAAMTAQADLNNTASDLVSTTISLQQVEEARANAQHFQTLKARGFADEEKKRQEALTKKNEEAAKKQQEIHDKRQVRLKEELDSKLRVYALDVAQARLAEDIANAGKRDPAKDDQSWISGLMGPLALAEQQIEANELERKSEEELAEIRRNTAMAKHSYIVAGIGDLARMNQAMKGSAIATKRIMQVEAVASAFGAASNTRYLVSKLFPPPIPEIMAGITLAAGLSNAAAIESQSFREGGVIEGSGGPRQDNRQVNVSNGESILNAEATGRLGREGVDRLNRGGGAGVTVVIQGNLIGTESFVRDTLIPQVNAALKRRLA